VRAGAVIHVNLKGLHLRNIENSWVRISFVAPAREVSELCLQNVRAVLEGGARQLRRRVQPR
jgi:hypothetical protein